MKQKYEVLEVNIPNLSMNDVIKVEGIKEMKETYPPSINVSEYEYVKKAESVDKEENDTNTTTTKNNSNNNTTSTTTKNNNNKITKTTTKNTTTTTTTTKAKPVTTTKPNTNNEILNKDDYVINLFNDEITNIENNKNNESFGSKVKNTFIKIVDFIFYDKDINGIYFKELTNTAKLKIISLALKIDNLIEKYFPTYKKDINAAYQNIKSKLVALYLDKTAEFCQKNDTACEQAKKDFQLMKYSLNLTWDVIKDLAGNGIAKLKQWYEIYSGK